MFAPVVAELEPHQLLDLVADDVWTLPCSRAPDHAPPGDWTLAFRRDAFGRVAAAQVGCSPARNLVYDGID